MRSTLARIAVVAAAALAWLAPPAQASGSLSLTATRFVWTGTGAADTLTVSGTLIFRPMPFPALERITFSSPSVIGVAASAQAACGDPDTVVTCARSDVTAVEANGLAGGDRLSWDDAALVLRFTLPVDFDGGAGDDRLSGSSAADVELAGGPDSDIIAGEGGNDVIDGDDPGAATTGSADTLNGGPGDDNLEGQGGDDSIDGSDGNDTRLAGDSGSDTITGGDGEDSIDGGAGDDTIVAGPENDVVNGGGGTGDRLRYDEPNRGGNVVVDLSTGSAGKDGGPGEVTEDALGIERVTGTALADSLTGDAQANTFNAGSGDDLLRGAGGDDVLRGGDGLDTASYSERAAGTEVVVTLDGVAGDGATGENDDVGSDIENVTGGAGNDRLTGNEGPNVLEGGAGADTLAGLAGTDTYRAGAGDDEVSARDGNPEGIDCGDGNADRAVADDEDQPSGCETVELPPGNGTGPPPPPRDADGDGVAEDRDCDDGDPRRRPGAQEILGNAVDENCRGGPAPFPVVRSTSELTSQRVQALRRVNLLALSVFDLRRGDVVTIVCRGRCSGDLELRRTVRNRTPRLRLDRAVKDQFVRTGAAMVVGVARTGSSAQFKEYRMRQSGTSVRTRRFCRLPGGEKDADCDGFRDLPLVRATARLEAEAGRRRTQLRTLRVARVRGGDTVTLSCAGPGCPPALGRAVTVPSGARTLRLDPFVRGVALRPDARLELFVARQGFVTRVFRWTIRAGRAPLSRTLCQSPGDRRPRRCDGG